MNRMVVQKVLSPWDSLFSRHKLFGLNRCGVMVSWSRSSADQTALLRVRSLQESWEIQKETYRVGVCENMIIYPCSKHVRPSISQSFQSIDIGSLGSTARDTHTLVHGVGMWSTEIEVKHNLDGKKRRSRRELSLFVAVYSARRRAPGPKN